MSSKEYYDKYKKEFCVKCANKSTEFCEIRISALNGIVETKCVYYETIKPKKG